VGQPLSPEPSRLKEGVIQLSSEYGTYTTVKARFWAWLVGKSPEPFSSCSLGRGVTTRRVLANTTAPARSPYLRIKDFVYHSTPGLRVIKKKKKFRGWGMVQDHGSGEVSSRDMTEPV